MAKLAGFVAFFAVFLALAAVLEVMDLLHVNGPNFPEWSYKPIGLFLAGFILSLAVIAFRSAESFVKRRRSQEHQMSSPNISEIRCQNPSCKAMNRVRKYSIRQIPRCSKCGDPLPERLLMRIIRLGYLNPLALIAVGGSPIVLSFFFLDRYLPGLGLIWNAINGTIGGFPYRYVLAFGIFLTLVGSVIALRNKTD
jgi:hypothetical protein